MNVVMVVMIIAKNERQVTEIRSIENRGPRRCNHYHGKDEGRREGRREKGGCRGGEEKCLCLKYVLGSKGSSIKKKVL